ncbi:uncharacterized protein LOC102800462 [Saccoglossus kowalevskii]|uniref:D(2) dopamine receptor-like n=1 Tax=Saccoglossus kowalevskii TaxID=10224 RepID=A0ABM0MXC4_SACKO|nr:PREDICTED: D(2) dopamine receptor-like [Saccoglossus kowalevskii]
MNITTIESWSQNEPLHFSVMVISSVLLIITFVVGIIGNTLVCLSVYYAKYLRTPNNALLVNLAIADLLTCIFNVPFVFVVVVANGRNPTGNLGDGLCSLQIAFHTFCSCCQLITLAAISVERYYAIAHPFRTKYRKKRVTGGLIIAWGISTLFAPLVAVKFKMSPQYKMCTGDTSDYASQQDTSSAYFISPIGGLALAVIIVFYIRIWITVHKHNKNMDQGMSPSRAHNKIKPEATHDVSTVEEPSVMAVGNQTPTDDIAKSVNSVVANKKAKIDSDKITDKDKLINIHLASAFDNHHHGDKDVLSDVGGIDCTTKVDISLPGSVDTSTVKVFDDNEINSISLGSTVKCGLVSGGLEKQSTNQLQTTITVTEVEDKQIKLTVEQHEKTIECDLATSNLDTSKNRDKRDTEAKESDVYVTPVVSVMCDDQVNVDTTNMSDKNGVNVQMTPIVSIVADNTELLTTPQDNLYGSVCVMNHSARERGKRRVEARTAKRAWYIIGSFIVCWFPLPLVTLIIAFNGEALLNKGILYDLEVCAVSIAMFGTASNPIVYALVNKQFKTEFLKILRKLKCYWRKK